MKKVIRWILFQLWRLQFKKVPVMFHIEGYHCRECEGGKNLDCGDFPCPCKPNEKLLSRFIFVKLNHLLNKWNTSAL
jgi:hypothetical protein